MAVQPILFHCFQLCNYKLNGFWESLSVLHAFNCLLLHSPLTLPSRSAVSQFECGNVLLTLYGPWCTCTNLSITPLAASNWFWHLTKTLSSSFGFQLAFLFFLFLSLSAAFLSSSKMSAPILCLTLQHVHRFVCVLATCCRKRSVCCSQTLTPKALSRWTGNCSYSTIFHVWKQFRPVLMIFMALNAKEFE